MYNFVLAIHVIVSLLLVVVILMQRGRGGGLVEALAGAESLFGTKTSSFLVRATTTLAVIFFITSMSLAFLSKQRGKSVFEKETKPAVSSQKEKAPSITSKTNKAQQKNQKPPAVQSEGAKKPQ